MLLWCGKVALTDGTLGRDFVAVLREVSHNTSHLRFLHHLGSSSSDASSYIGGDDIQAAVLVIVFAGVRQYCAHRRVAVVTGVVSVAASSPE